MFDFNQIKKDENLLSRRILDEMYPGQKFSDATREQKSIEDIKWMLLFISEALKTDNVKIVENLIIWFKRLFKGLKIETYHADLLFEKTKLVLHDFYDEILIDQFLEKVQVKESTKIKHNQSNPFQKEMEKYLKLLLESKRKESQEFILELKNNGMSIKDIYIYVFQTTMEQVGELWHDGIIPVGKEHYCTAVTQFNMGMLYGDLFNRKSNNKKLLACAVGSELHEMGIRMVADLFEFEGWDTNYLGANLPVKEIVNTAIEFEPDVIALSITMPYHITLLKEAIEKIKSTPSLQDIKVIVGGRPFYNNETLYQIVNADGYAKNASEGIRLANELLQ